MLTQPSKTRSVHRYIAPCSIECKGFRKRLHSIGVRLIDTRPDTRIATPIVIANSCSRRPTIPPMNSTGMKTAASDTVIDRIVNATSFDASNDARIGDFPISMCRTMFSSITIASSTTKPTDRVRAIRERLSRLYSSRYITVKVAMSEAGNARLAMIVAERLRRNRKTTTTTSTIESTSVSFTSCTDSRIGPDRSLRMSSETLAGNCSRIDGSIALISSTTCTTLLPGCFRIVR